MPVYVFSYRGVLLKEGNVIASSLRALLHEHLRHLILQALSRRVQIVLLNALNCKVDFCSEEGVTLEIGILDTSEGRDDALLVRGKRLKQLVDALGEAA